MKRKQFAIYTACIGGYDNILQPEAIDDKFDYILFSDDVAEDSVGVWQVRCVDYTSPDKTRIARWVKTHPEELLPQYKATLWMDSNIQIISPWVYSRFMELYKSNSYIASIKHPERDCIYDEAYIVSSYTVFGALEHEKIAMTWCRKLRSEHYPRHNGLYETNILFRENNPIIQAVDSMWWICIDNYSKRDQLSFNYTLWKNGLSTDTYFFPKEEHAQNSEKVKYIRHRTVSQRKQIPLSLFERLRCRYKSIRPEYSQKLWHKMIQSNSPLIINLAYETIISGIYVSIHKLRKLLRV